MPSPALVKNHWVRQRSIPESLKRSGQESREERHTEKLNTKQRATEAPPEGHGEGREARAGQAGAKGFRPIGAGNLAG